MDAKSIEKSMDMHRCSPNREYGHLFSIPLYHIYSYCTRLSRSSSVSMSMSVFVSMCGHVLVSANNDVICLYPFFLSLLLFGGGKGEGGWEAIVLRTFSICRRCPPLEQLQFSGRQFLSLVHGLSCYFSLSAIYFGQVAGNGQQHSA